MNSNIDEKRVSREKEWHNQTFGTDTRVQMDKFYTINVKMYENYIQKINENLDKKNTKFLDYGCGGGKFLMQFTAQIKEGIGIDISDAYIENAKQEAKQRGLKNLDFFVMDAMNTKFNVQEFDIITGTSILHHLDLQLSLTEIKRILKNTGIAFFREPLDTNPLIKLYRKLTPKARTIDEQPLRIKDIELIKNIFPNTEIYYYSFFTLFAVPFRNTKYFDKIITFLYSLDKIILHKSSPFKHLAWFCALILKK